jgi:ketosteroid isomerase-like protein
MSTTLRLRTAALATVLLLLLPVTLRAQATDQGPNPLHTASKQELDVVKVLVAQENAWNRGDLDGFFSGYKDSPETLFITSQIHRGYADMIEGYRRTYSTRAAMGTLSFSELEVHPLSDTFAVAIGKYHLERTKKDGGPASGLFSLVLEKTDKGWKIVVDHTT